MKHLCAVFFFFLTITTLSAQSACASASLPDTASTSTLAALRTRIDSLDNALLQVLSERMKVCEAVGEYKKQKGIAVVQSNRYHELVNRLCRLGTSLGLTDSFVKQLMDLIHEESVRRQNELNGKQQTGGEN